jgi:hypothetical protein
MPVHDWTKVDSGLFHAFHQGWIASLTDRLNNGCLPPDYYALAAAPPRRAWSRRNEAVIYACRADLITVRNTTGDVAATIEIVSPGSKASSTEFKSFIAEMTKIIYQKTNLLLIDLFPTGSLYPQGIHKAIWDELNGDRFTMRPEKSLTLASYSASSSVTAHVEAVVSEIYSSTCRCFSGPMPSSTCPWRRLMKQLGTSFLRN